MVSVLYLYYNFKGQKAQKTVSALEGVSLIWHNNLATHPAIMSIGEYWKPPTFPEIGSSYDSVIIHRLGHHYCTGVCGTDLQNIGEEKFCKTSQTYEDICVAITYSLHSNPELLIIQNVALSLALIFFIFSTLVKVNEGIYTRKKQVYIWNS